jgi:hypothetical protein
VTHPPLKILGHLRILQHYTNIPYSFSSYKNGRSRFEVPEARRLQSGNIEWNQ